MKNAKPIANARVLIASLAATACCAPGVGAAHSGPDYPPNRDGYGSSTNPYYAQPGDPGYFDYRDRLAGAARFHGIVESVEIESRGVTGEAAPRPRIEIQHIRVRMDDGSMQVFSQDAPEIRVGDRVRVESDGYLELA